jgi:hypothetical protein
LACKLNFCFFSNSPTTVWLTLCPRLQSSSASRRRLLQVQRSGHRIAARVRFDQRVQIVEQTGVRFVQRFRPPPGRRTPASVDAGGASRSFSPRPIVLAAMRVTRETAAMPPCPADMRLRSGENPSLPFIQSRRYRRMAGFELSQRIFVDHRLRYDDPTAKGIRPPHFHPNPIRLFPDRP